MVVIESGSGRSGMSERFEGCCRKIKFEGDDIIIVTFLPTGDKKSVIPLINLFSNNLSKSNREF